MNLINKRILIISPENWNHIPVSKHHYAKALAKHNSVFFLNPPESENNIFLEKNGITVISYKNKVRGINLLPFWIKNFFNKIEISALNSIWKSLDIVWSFDPYRFQNLALFKARFKIYHTVDVHQLKSLEKQIGNSADLILTSSNQLKIQINSKTPAFFINHGLAQHFVKEAKPYKPTKKRELTIGYVGNLNYKYIDHMILEKIVSDNKKLNFKFIGPFKPKDLLYKNLSKYSNCEFNGQVNSALLPKLFDSIDIFLLCYKAPNNPAILANPHKVLEFLSSGKVVVSHYIDQYKNYKNLIEMVYDNEELPNKLKEVISNITKYNSTKLYTERLDFALKNQYTNQIEKIGKLIS